MQSSLREGAHIFRKLISLLFKKIIMLLSIDIVSIAADGYNVEAVC